MLEKFNYLILSLSLMFLKLYAEEHVERLGNEAQAFMYAQDYDKASQIYHYLSTQPLPTWQQALVLYNLGTVKLAQAENQSALDYFRSISYDAIVNPHLFRMINFNQALAYLNEARKTPADPSHFELKEQFEAYENSLKKLEITQKLDCLLAKFENHSDPCPQLNTIAQLMIEVRQDIQNNKNAQRQNLFKVKNFDGTFFIFLQSLGKLYQIIDSVDLLTDQLQPYLTAQSDSIFSLWEGIGKKQMTTYQREIFNQAGQCYYHFLVELQKNAIESAKKQLQKCIEEIVKMRKDVESVILAELLIQYELTLLQESLDFSSLKKLQKVQISLKSVDLELLNQANEYLEKSIKELSQTQQNQSEFFLNAAFERIQKLEPLDSSQPIEVLRRALLQAWQNKKMLSLYLRSLSNPLDDSLSYKVLENAQKHVIDLADLFFSSVLVFQKKNFQSIDNNIQRCQDKPWDQVLPLFDKGKLAALQTLHLIKHPQQAILAEEETIKNWKEALKLLSQPISGGAANEEKKIEQSNDIIKLIQEMQAQDKPQKEILDQEWHTW